MLVSAQQGGVSGETGGGEVCEDNMEEGEDRRAAAPNNSDAQRQAFDAGSELLIGPPLQEHDEAAYQPGGAAALRQDEGKEAGSGPISAQLWLDTKQLWLDGWVLPSSLSPNLSHKGVKDAGRLMSVRSDTRQPNVRPTCQSLSTLGFRYKAVHLTIFSVEDGGPAHKHGHVLENDRIVSVNEHLATQQNIESLLRADDPPGTVVDMELEDSGTGKLKKVRLTRAPLPASALTADTACAATNDAGVGIKAPREFQF